MWHLENCNMLVTLGVVLLAGLSALADSPQQGDTVDVWPCDASNERQIWTVQNGSWPNARIVLTKTSNPQLVLDITEWSNSSDAQLHIWTPTNTEWNQEWSYFPSSGEIRSRMNGHCVDVIGGGAVEGLSAVMNPCDGSMTQRWTVEKSSGLIQSQANTSVCLDAGSVGSGGNCTSGGTISKLPFCNPSLPVQERAEDLVNRLFPIEKSLALSNSDPGVGRLGVPHMPFGEALHGVLSGCGAPYNGSTGCPTSFPHALALGSTFNRSLWTQVADTIGHEARALHNQNVWGGLMAWAPDINLFAAPEWGRGQEVPGEDPLLNGEYAFHYISAMVGADENPYDLVGATAKHATVYGRETPANETRHNFNADVLWSELVSYYWVQWRSAIQRGKARSIMCSYNAVSTEDMPSTPSCANDFFQNVVFRQDFGWNDEGPNFFVSDCGAIGDIQVNHHYVATGEEAVAVAMKAGTAVDCGSMYNRYLFQAYTNKSVSDEELNLANTQMYGTAMRLGLFDDPSRNPYSSLGPADVDTPEHRQLALEAARQSMTLLTNPKSTLPLSSSAKVALIGPNANATQTLLSNYHGTNTLVDSHSIQLALQGRIGSKMTFAYGCDISSMDTSGFAGAISAAKAADVAVMVMGLDQSQESEGHDRTTLVFPGVQEELIQQVAATGTPVVLVLVNGGPIAVENVTGVVDAILEARYPGEMGGDAVVDALYGDVSPAGRLTTTWYMQEYMNVRSVLNSHIYPMDGQPGQTYLYYPGPFINFPAFTGLSYTTFKFTPVSGTPTLHTSSLDLPHTDAVAVATGGEYVVNVTNTGKVTSDVVVLGFVTNSSITTTSTTPTPLRQLFDFQRVAALQPGQTVQVILTMPAEALLVTHSDGSRSFAPGTHRVVVGDEPTQGPNGYASFSLEIKGEEKWVMESVQKRYFEYLASKEDMKK